MPTKHVTADVMDVGKKGGGKHWTKSQVEARKDAAESVKRVGPVVLDPPEWLHRDAIVEWNKALANIEGLDLLDNLDGDALAIYCDAKIKYRKLSTRSRLTAEGTKSLQAWARIIIQYADKLGFTPAARARLVKKRADEKPKDTFGEKFD
jgi:phage terminase small subunit